MRAVEIMRQELDRLELTDRLAPEIRRLLTNKAKEASKQGKSPRITVSQALTAMLNTKGGAW